MIAPLQGVEIVLHSCALEVTKGRHFEQLVEVIQHRNVKEMVIDHDVELAGLWSLDQLKRVADNVKISKLSVFCFDILEDNVGDFIDLFSKIGNVEILIDFDQGRDRRDAYTFTLRDFELMVDRNIRVIEVSSNLLELFEVDLGLQSLQF